MLAATPVAARWPASCGCTGSGQIPQRPQRGSSRGGRPGQPWCDLDPAAGLLPWVPNPDGTAGDPSPGAQPGSPRRTRPCSKHSPGAELTTDRRRDRRRDVRGAARRRGPSRLSGARGAGRPTDSLVGQLVRDVLARPRRARPGPTTYAPFAGLDDAAASSTARLESHVLFQMGRTGRVRARGGAGGVRQRRARRRRAILCPNADHQLTDRDRRPDRRSLAAQLDLGAEQAREGVSRDPVGALDRRPGKTPNSLKRSSLAPMRFTYAEAMTRRDVLRAAGPGREAAGYTCDDRRRLA